MRAHNPTQHHIGTHSVRRTCFSVCVRDRPASPSGVVSVPLLLFLMELCPVERRREPVCVKTSPLRCRMCFKEEKHKHKNTKTKETCPVIFSLLLWGETIPESNIFSCQDVQYATVPGLILI